MTSGNLFSTAAKVLLALTAALAVASTPAIAGTTTYTYDAQGRLTQVVYPNGSTVTYTYDAAGNRTQVVATV